jgi:hypothetical protein
MTATTEQAREEHAESASAITVRLGIWAGGVLGGFVGYWIGMLGTPAGGVLWTWPSVVGATVGFVTVWAALPWLTRKHKGAGVIAGGILMLAAAAALIAWCTRLSR